MQCFILFGWALFRAPNLSWFFQALRQPQWDDRAAWQASVMIFALLALYALLFWLIGIAQHRSGRYATAQAAFHAVLFLIIVLFHHGQANDFIYFRF